MMQWVTGGPCGPESKGGYLEIQTLASICAVLIIAPQSLSWQPLINDLQGGFTARLNLRRMRGTLIN